MECNEVIESLEAYDAGELSERERARIAEYLVACPDCQRKREEMLALGAELRSAGDSFRALRPFTVEATPGPTRRRRRWLSVVGVAAAVWMILVTAAVFWPSFAERLSFLPLGRRLSEATTAASPSLAAAGDDAAANGLSLSDAPRAALAAVDALFEPPGGRLLPFREAISAPLSKLLPDDLARGVSSVRIVAIGPVQRLSEDELGLIVAVDITHGEAPGAEKSQRHRLLLTVTRSPQGSWTVSDLQVVVD